MISANDPALPSAVDGGDEPYDLRRDLEQVSLELQAARKELPPIAPVNTPMRRTAANESIQIQRFRGLVTISAHSHVDAGVHHKRVPAICAVDHTEIVLLGGPELSTPLLTIPLAHIDAHAEASLDHVFSIDITRDPSGRSSKSGRADSKVDTRVYVHVESKTARDSWLQVLDVFKVDITGWPEPLKTATVWSDPLCPRTFANCKIFNKVKIGFGRCASFSGGEGAEDPSLLGKFRGRRLSLNNGLPLVIWI